MMPSSIIVVGGPDSGKTNFIGRLWRSLAKRAGAYVADAVPENIGFVSDTAEHLFGGRFAPRTQRNEGRRDFEIAIRPAVGGKVTQLVIPDIHGELWQLAVQNSELPTEWMNELKRASGAMLFVRVQSDLNVNPLDWVNSKRLLANKGHDEHRDKLPTQVMLCELLRVLELRLARRPDGGLPRVALMVAAWDLVDTKVFAAGPMSYLAGEYPLLGGKLGDTSLLDVRVFGVSVAGGDLEADVEYRDSFLENGLDANGWVAVYDAAAKTWTKNPDLTLPVGWVVGE